MRQLSFIVAALLVVGIAGGAAYLIADLLDTSRTGKNSQAQSTNIPRAKAGVCVEAIRLSPSDSTNAPSPGTSPGSVVVPSAFTTTPGDSDVEALAADKLKSALDELASTHPLWSPAGLAGAPAVVDQKCPSDPFPITWGVKWISAEPDATAWWPRVVASSYYPVFVFVVPSEGDLDALLGGSARRVAPQEFVCADEYSERCVPAAEVTTALYVTADEVRGGMDLSRWLAQAFGLEERR